MGKKITWTNVPCSFHGEVFIKYTSSGYYDPGQYYGRPENCYEAEGDDERVITGIEIDGKPLPADLVKALSPYFEEQMMKEDGPDRSALEEYPEEDIDE